MTADEIRLAIEDLLKNLREMYEAIESVKHSGLTPEEERRLSEFQEDQLRSIQWAEAILNGEPLKEPPRVFNRRFAAGSSLN